VFDIYRKVLSKEIVVDFFGVMILMKINKYIVVSRYFFRYIHTYIYTYIKFG